MSLFYLRFSVISDGNSLKNCRKEGKRLKPAEKKCFDHLSGARSTRNLIKIHNTHYLMLLNMATTQN